MRIDKIQLSGSLLISSSLSRSPLRINDNYLYINPQGNIGIGTTNPTSKLVVTGSVAVKGQLRATTLSGSFTGSIKLPTIPLGTSETNIVLVDGSGGLVYRSNLSLTGAQGNQGATGIQGTNGTVGTQGFQGNQGAQGNQGIQGTVGTQGATGASAGITSYTNPADNRVITSVSSTTVNAETNLTFDGTTLTVVAGDLKITAGSISVGGNIANSATDGRIDASNDIVAFSTSDRRLKENINNIQNPIEKILKLNGVEFDWIKEHFDIHGYDGNDVGVIAQDLKDVLPQALRINDSGYYAVRYEKIIPLLIECIKELNNEIKILKEK